MANPTTYFGWVMPTSSSLVTNLPADFNTFGQGVDTSMQYLKGGTTGQILSKTSATDMAFTWISNDVGDITAVTAGTGISGGGTSGTVTITNDMATTITASGDIVVGTGSGTYDNLPIGTTGQVLTADTTVSPYKVKWAAAASGNTNPAFRAYRATSNQSVTTNVRTKVQFNAENYDTNSCFDSTTNYRFTPTVAGYYQMNMILGTGGTLTRTQRQMESSTLGSIRISDIAANEPSIIGGTDLVYFNGTTDYIECYVTLTGTSPNITYGSDYSHFSGVWVRS